MGRARMQLCCSEVFRGANRRKIAAANTKVGLQWLSIARSVCFYRRSCGTGMTPEIRPLILPLSS